MPDDYLTTAQPRLPLPIQTLAGTRSDSWSCPKLIIPNGALSIKQEAFVGTVAMVTCEAGSYLDGSETLTCLGSDVTSTGGYRTHACWQYDCTVVYSATTTHTRAHMHPHPLHTHAHTHACMHARVRMAHACVCGLTLNAPDHAPTPTPYTLFTASMSSFRGAMLR